MSEVKTITLAEIRELKNKGLLRPNTKSSIEGSILPAEFWDNSKLVQRK